MENPILWMLIAIIVVGAALALVMSLSRHTGRGLNQDEFRSKWMEITRIFAKENPMSWQVAIMEADKLLDQALIAAGARGNTLGERLKSSSSKFSKINAVWGAHKLRNQIAHEPNARISYPMTEQALGAFKQALKDVGAI